jgi:hypothetical protein
MTYTDHATLKELWPDIVNAYFKALSNPACARCSKYVDSADLER